jgi:hypothetical protein
MDPLKVAESASCYSATLPDLKKPNSCTSALLLKLAQNSKLEMKQEKK